MEVIARNDDHVTRDQSCLLPVMPGEIGFAFVDDPD